jgi:hypothetical protein
LGCHQSENPHTLQGVQRSAARGNDTIPTHANNRMHGILQLMYAEDETQLGMINDPGSRREVD